jgi:TetR/AcrR family fatty acid metabolism transcriptional regulator
MGAVTSISEIANTFIENLRVVPLREGEKHKLILDAALDLMSQYGYRKTSIDEIAERAGVAKGTVYLYFRDKREILISLLKERIGGLASKVLKATEDEPDIPSKMLKAIRFVIEFHKTDAIVNQIFARSPEIIAPIFSGIAPIEKIVSSFIEGLLRAGVAEGSVDPGVDPEMTALILFRFNQATILRIKTGAEIDVDRYLKALEWLVFNGIRKRS